MADFVFCLSIVLLFLTTIQNVDVTAELLTERTEQHPARDFTRHTLIKPRIYHGREKRQISKTKDEGNDNYHIDHITITIPIEGEDYILDLTLNKQLIPKGFFRKIQDKGRHKVTKPHPSDINFCHYSGTVRNKPNSWVALSTCDGLSGVVFDGEEMHYIEKNNQNQHSETGDHFLYKHSDLAQHNKSCGFPDADHSLHEPFFNQNNRILRYKRSSENTELVKGPYNANKESKYVELVLVVDNREYKELGESVSKVEHHCQHIANIINGLYAPLNIFIALVGVVIWTEHDEISFAINGDTTLTNFLHYRREKLIKAHPNDNAQLLTKFTFENGVVGKALKGPICTYEYSGGVNTDHSPVVGLVATTVAHEMGHNFGMEHDTNECKCPDDRCIMAPSSSTVAPTHWSSCSLNYLLLAFTHGMDYCLKNKPESLFNSPVCGNGFVEPGEQCDCGLPEHCENSCCDPKTCMLYVHASCATGECCDLTTCKPKNAGTLCRSADYECDLPEYCTGQSEYCPSDIYKMDTEVCDNGNAFCYHGFCRTRTDQCRLLWGETGKTSDEQCYKMNIKGNRHGNCGYNKFNQSFFKCNDDNVLCGMLHCKHLNERLEFGMESVAILSHSFINSKGSIIACRTAIVDLGINQIDPGLAPDGAKCGENKMCVNQKCMSVASLQLENPNCPENCNNNGWCNNLGHCHCKNGYAPPFCTNPGPGGSEDSGPASDPNPNREFVVALFVVFLGIVPILVIFAFIYYYLRQNVLKVRLTKSTPTTSKSPSKSRGAPFSPNSANKRTTEDNHSLLLQQEESAAQPNLYNEFFGNFKGFSLTPMKKSEPEPIRPAPLPPSPPSAPPITRPAPTAPPTEKIKRENSFKHNLSGALGFVNQTSTAPALPPPNPGSTGKLIISSPILENSTCTAKELISPLRNAPKVPIRPAPEVPPQKENPTRPLSSTEAVVVAAPSPTEEIKPKKESGISLNRIASFLKSNDKKLNIGTNSLPRQNQQVKANKILDKSALRSIEISSPILQSEQPALEIKTVIPVGTNGENKTNVTRAQSMRGIKVTPRPNIQTFGSMRQPGFKRPLSIPSGSRPKSPPPPAPPNPDKKLQIPSLPGYQKPTSKSTQNQYDDCLNNAAPLAQIHDDLSPSSSDNIYAVIEESPIVSPESSITSPEKSKTSSTSNDSMGLLGEIVSEIQNRNFDSIYSTSTLARKKKEEEEKRKIIEDDSSSCYVNTSSIYKSPSESVYSNMNNVKSSASSTSSGYILPSAVNVPVKPPPPRKEEQPEPKLTTFKAADAPKPYTSTFSRAAGPLAASYSTNKTGPKPDKTPPSPTNNKSSKTAISRQVTPPNLRTRKPSPTRTQTNKPRPVSNSPDLVTSCNTNKSKTPDVVNNGKKPIITTAKPTLNGLPKAPVKSKAVSFSNKAPAAPAGSTATADKKNNSAAKANSDASPVAKANAGVKIAARSNSNVASLQQKFENKNKSAPKIKT